MIDEKWLGEFREAYKLVPSRIIQSATDPSGPTHIMVKREDFEEVLDTIEAALKVVRAGNQIEDMLEAPRHLGGHAKDICQKAIDDFREALKPFAKAASEG